MPNSACSTTSRRRPKRSNALLHVAHPQLALLMAREVLLAAPANTQSDTPSTLSASSAYSSFFICLWRAWRAAFASTDTSGTRNTAVPSTSSIASASQSENQPRHATSTTNSSHAVTVGNTVRRYRF